LEIQTQLFEGCCEGRIADGPSGSGGFGYDPLFVPTGFEESFAALGEEVKNSISHRGRALVKLREYLSGLSKP
jgi:XTP/dITP diphosphohydrolase